MALKLSPLIWLFPDQTESVRDIQGRGPHDSALSAGLLHRDFRQHWNSFVPQVTTEIIRFLKLIPSFSELSRTSCRVAQRIPSSATFCKSRIGSFSLNLSISAFPISISIGWGFLKNYCRSINALVLNGFFIIIDNWSVVGWYWQCWDLR